MLRTDAAPECCAQLDDAGWDALDELAGLHRLQPMLHAEWSTDARRTHVAAPIARRWREAHRESALRALLLRRELLATTQLLSGAAIHPVALKGPWLAWHAYPEPAQRPMRDLDLLVRREEALPAWRLLRAAGYAATDRDPDPESVHGHKHLPPLVSPGGVAIELHARCWEDSAIAGYSMPDSDDDGFRARSRSIGDTGPRYPAPADMLAHLVVHAVHTHRLDVGPQILIDLDWLVLRQEPDWQALWRTASDRGWANGLALVLTLADRWRRPGLLRRSGYTQETARGHIPERMVDLAGQLMLQNMGNRAGASMMARAGRGWRPLLRAKLGEAAGDPLDFARAAPRRARELLAGWRDPSARRTARGMAELSDWLETH